MKKLIVLVVCMCFCYCASCQAVIGSFSYMNDGELYLVFKNRTSYNFNAVGSVYRNGNLYNQEQIYFTPGASFMLGPSTPWRWHWQNGDVYIITYPDGTTSKWTCTIGNSGPSFKGSDSLWWGEGNPPGADKDGYIKTSETITLQGHTYHVYSKRAVKYIYDKKKGWCRY